MYKNGAECVPFFIVLVIAASSSSVNPEKKEVELRLDLWKETHPPFEKGFPLLKEKNETATSLPFIPKFTILYSDLKISDSVTLKFDSLINVILYFYEGQYPISRNYRINVISRHIEKCHGVCKELNICKQAEIRYDKGEEFNENIVYLSWIKQEQLFVQIIFQYKNLLVKCMDFDDPIKISKLVMYSSEKQYVATTRPVFKYTTEETKFNSTGLYLSYGYSVYLEVLKCRRCKMNFCWNCYPLNCCSVNSSPYYQTNVTFSDGFISDGWQGMIIPGPPRNDSSNCTLQIETSTLPNVLTIEKKFWSLIPTVALIKNEKVTTTTTTTTTTSTPETSTYETTTENETTTKKYDTTPKKEKGDETCTPVQNKINQIFTIVICILILFITDRSHKIIKWALKMYHEKYKPLRSPQRELGMEMEAPLHSFHTTQHTDE